MTSGRRHQSLPQRCRCNHLAITLRDSLAQWEAERVTRSDRAVCIQCRAWGGVFASSMPATARFVVALSSRRVHSSCFRVPSSSRSFLRRATCVDSVLILPPSAVPNPQRGERRSGLTVHRMHHNSFCACRGSVTDKNALFHPPCGECMKASVQQRIRAPASWPGRCPPSATSPTRTEGGGSRSPRVGPCR